MIFVSLILAGATGYVAEKYGFTRNGYIVSIALAIGGAMILFFAQYFFGIRLGFGRALTAIIGAAGMLFIASLRR